MAFPSRLFFICAFAAALCFAGTTAFADSTKVAADSIVEASKLSKAKVHHEPTIAPTGSVEFFTRKGPESVTKTLQPGASIEVHLHDNAGTPYQWKVAKKGGADVTEITKFKDYTDNPKLRGMTGGPMVYQVTVTAPSSPGSYPVYFEYANEQTVAASRTLTLEVSEESQEEVMAVPEESEETATGSVEFFTRKGPESVTKTLQPGASIEVHLHDNAGTPYQWKVAKKGGADVTEITKFKDYTDNPKLSGMTGGPMVYQVTVTAPSSPGSYPVSFEYANEQTVAASRTLTLEVSEE